MTFAAASSTISLPQPRQPVRLYRMALSGHCHRVELFLSLLGLPYELIEVDLAGGEHKRPAFLQLNPFGQVPVLFDSNAILVYLANRHAPDTWLPRDPLGAARVQAWLSAAAGPLAHGAAAARVILLFKRPQDPAPAQAQAVKLLEVMTDSLARQPFLAGDSPTLADVALYSYTAAAPEGGVDLSAWPGVRDWLARIEALPGFVPMPRQRAAQP
ncbi:MAG: glutathione S-transferase [Curvibacter sp.]|nr:glutathione S-transferase [Curvibacter sp.]